MVLRLALLSAALCCVGVPAHADDVGCTSTTFHLFSPNDKVCVQAFDDPRVSGVTCHISQAKTGGWKGAVGVAEDPSPLCHRLSPNGTDHVARWIAARGKRLQRKHVARLQEHQGRADVRSQTQHARLHRCQQAGARRVADERALRGSHHALGGTLTGSPARLSGALRPDGGPCGRRQTLSTLTALACVVQQGRPGNHSLHAKDPPRPAGLARRGPARHCCELRSNGMFVPPYGSSRPAGGAIGRA